MMSVSAIRIPVLNFFTNIFDTYISIYFEEEKEDFNIPTSIEDMYLPSYIPDGYIQIESQNYGTSAKTIWMKDSSIMVLSQEIMQEEFHVHINNEGVTYQTFSVNGNSIYYYVKDGYYFFIWTNGSYLLSILAPDLLPLSEIEKIISSLEETE